MEVDLNLIRRGLKKILISSDRREAAATADMLLAYMDSMEGKMVDTEPEIALPNVSDSSTFTARFTAEPTQKIAVIKDLRAAFNFGLKEAKDFVEGLPWKTVTKHDLPKLQQVAQKHIGLQLDITSNEGDLDF
jgi:ribosomal protein L7/L12